MKYKHSFSGLVVGSILLVASGCGKQDQPAGTAAENTQQNGLPAARQTQRTGAPRDASSAPLAKPAEPTVASTTQPSSAAQPSSTSQPAFTAQSNSNAQPDSAAQSTPATQPASATQPAPAGTNNASLAADAQRANLQSLALGQSTTTATAQALLTLAASNTTSNAASLASNLSQAVSRGRQRLQAQTAPVTTNQILATLLDSTNPVPAITTAATGQVLTAATATTNQVQALIEKAKGLMANQKYQEALNTVQGLYGKLTPEQQQMVDNLKTQLQTALAKQAATNATSILGNILGGKN